MCGCAERAYTFLLTELAIACPLLMFDSATARKIKDRQCLALPVFSESPILKLRPSEDDVAVGN